MPDAVTGVCATPCPDGSPRLLGVCTQSGRCSGGSVDVGGRCFHAAPVRARTRDVPSGVTYRCGVGGCSYWIPAGGDACRRPRGCVVSCAAPRSVLVAGSRGVACSF